MRQTERTRHRARWPWLAALTAAGLLYAAISAPQATAHTLTAAATALSTFLTAL